MGLKNHVDREVACLIKVANWLLKFDHIIIKTFEKHLEILQNKKLKNTQSYIN